MLKRTLSIPNNNSFFLFGARGVGKTSLIRSLFERREDVLFIDLLDFDLFDRYSLSPQILRKEIEVMDKRPQWVVLDEVQKVPELLNVVHQLIESEPRIHFVLLGSSSRRLKQKGVNLLAGRAWLRSLFPFTSLELEEQFDLAQALNWGTLPKIFQYENESDKVDFLKAYAHTYVKTEVQEEQWVRKILPFRRFLPIAAQMNGKPLNYLKISRDVGVGVTVIQSYFEILEDTLLGFHLPSYNKSIRKQQREAAKFYFFDTGVKKALQKTLDAKLVSGTSEWGQAFEHFVICEFHRLNEYYKKDYELSYLLTKDGFEIDLILSKANQPDIYIEIKSAEKVHEKEFNHLASVGKEQKAKVFVLSNDSINRIDSGVHFLHWQEGLKKIFSIED